MKPKISIITVCYNSEAHLEEAIQSVVNQPYENKEYIIIDGGSKDHTMDIVNKYRDKITYVVSEPDKGISDAFNKGIMAATGDIIGICNSDDILADDILMKIAEAYDTDVDIYRTNEVIKDFETGEEFLMKPTLEFPKVPYTSVVCHMGCFISKKAYEKYGMYDVECRYVMDWELMRRFSYNNATYKYIPVVCGYFRKGGTSQDNEKKMRNERRKVVMKYGGSKLDAEKLIIFYCFKNYLKKFLSLFGKNIATKLRYIKNGK